MPLPQQVVDRLGQEPAKTPGWSVEMLFFSVGLLFISVVIFLGFTFGYEPYLNTQIAHLSDQINQLSQSISADDQTRLVTIYSQISNLQSLTQNHVLFSHFLAWLEKNTEANLYFSGLSFSSGNQVTLSANAKTQADMIQQVALFEGSPEVQDVGVSTISVSPTTGFWELDFQLTVDPGVFLQQSP